MLPRRLDSTSLETLGRLDSLCANHGRAVDAGQCRSKSILMPLVIGPIFGRPAGRHLRDPYNLRLHADDHARGRIFNGWCVLVQGSAALANKRFLPASCRTPDDRERHHH